MPASPRPGAGGPERIGVFGGTFDPPHVGHLRVAEAAREALGLDRVLWMPAATNPHKQGQAQSPPEHRLAMVRLATADHPAFEVSGLELDRSGASYTVDTLRALAAARPGVDWTLLVGGDSLASFARWREPEAILGLARLAVYPRPGVDLSALPADVLARAAILDAPLLDVSATAIRAMLKAGRSARYLVPDAVLAYADARALYRASGAV